MKKLVLLLFLAGCSGVPYTATDPCGGLAYVAAEGFMSTDLRFFGESEQMYLALEEEPPDPNDPNRILVEGVVGVACWAALILADF